MSQRCRRKKSVDYKFLYLKICIVKIFAYIELEMSSQNIINGVFLLRLLNGKKVLTLVEE